MVRIAAIESLAQIEDIRSIPEIEICLKDQDPLVRAYAAIGLAELGCDECLPRISNALAAERDDAAAVGFLVAMYMLGDEAKLPELLALLSSSQYRVRCFGANSLLDLNFSDEERRLAKTKLEEAMSHALALADAEAMSRVLEKLK